MRKIMVICVYLLFPFLLLAQKERIINDIKKDSICTDLIQIVNQEPTKFLFPKSIGGLYNTNISKYNKLSTPFVDLPKLEFYVGAPIKASYSRNPYANDYDYSGIINIDKSSWIVGGSTRQSYPSSIMQGATAIYNRRITDRLNIGIGGTINKYSVNGGKDLISEGRFHAVADYRINDRMNLSLESDYSLSRTKSAFDLGSLSGRYLPEMPRELFYGLRPIYSTNLTLDYQITSWLQFSPSMYFSRYEFFNNHLSDYGINGMLGIQIHDYARLNIFGQKSIRKPDSGIGNQGMHPQDMYGAGIEIKLTDKIGVETGIIRELNPWSGKWVNKPYVKPVFYIK